MIILNYSAFYLFLIIIIIESIYNKKKYVYTYSIELDFIVFFFSLVFDIIFQIVKCIECKLNFKINFPLLEFKFI